MRLFYGANPSPSAPKLRGETRRFPAPLSPNEIQSKKLLTVLTGLEYLLFAEIGTTPEVSVTSRTMVRVAGLHLGQP
jgi:hypothetical protein